MPKWSAKSRVGVDDAKLVYIQPHMHLRGKDYELARDLSHRRNGNGIQGQMEFRLATRISARQADGVPKGTRMVAIAHYDNSREQQVQSRSGARTIVWGRSELGRDAVGCFIGLVFDVQIEREKVFSAVGPSLMPRGHSGPTLAALEAAKTIQNRE